MQFTQITLALCLALSTGINGFSVAGKRQLADGSITSHNNNTRAAGRTHQVTLKAQCNEINRLAQLTNLASNATRLAEFERKRNLTAAGLAKLQEEVNSAGTRLTALRANTTLIGDCAIVSAHQRFLDQCHEISHLQRLVNLGNNATVVSNNEQRRNLTSKQTIRLQSQVTNAQARLDRLTANETLASGCNALSAQNKFVSQCRQLATLGRLARLASNQTLLASTEQRRNLTASQLSRFQRQASTAAVRFAELSANTTLVDGCAALEPVRKTSNRTIVASKRTRAVRKRMSLSAWF